MKSGALLYILGVRGLALADFGRHQRSINSWRARRFFLSGKQREVNLDRFLTIVE